LQGPCDSEQHSTLLLGVWLSPSNVDKQRLVEDLARLDLSESDHVLKGTSDSDNHPSQPSTQEPALDLVQVKRHLGILLQTIETDLRVLFFPLMVYYWSSQPSSLQSTVPVVPKSFPHLAFLTWHIFQDTFKEVYPDHAAIWRKLRNGSFSFNWCWWVRWANPELALSNLGDTAKPTALELNEFMQAWEVLWEGLLQFIPRENLESAVRSRANSLASWKTLADRFLSTSKG
jgi:hypothetical protein